jgi:uncharacterized membrane protein
MTGAGPVSLAHVLANAPWWLYIVLIVGLALHIGAGSVAILSGYGTVAVRKGEDRHRRLGRIFVIAMLVMASAAVTMATLLFRVRPIEVTNIAAGLLAAYLVTTGFMAVRRPEMTVGVVERIALAVALAACSLFLFWGLQATASPSGTFDGYPAIFYYVFAGFTGFAAALDVKVIRRGGIAGVQRISRHLWRMCAAFFFAAGSLFLGQQKIMPVWMHGSPVLVALAVTPLTVMVFWLVRVRIGRRFKTVPAAS